MNSESGGLRMNSESGGCLEEELYVPRALKCGNLEKMSEVFQLQWSVY
jgi:hypothetical protein